MHRQTGLSPPVKYLTDRFKAVLLLWIFYVFSVLCLICICMRLFICALWSPAWKGLTYWLSFFTPIPHRPRIARIAMNLFFSYSGGFVRFHYFFFSNRDELRVIPDSDRMSLRIFGAIGSIRLESRKNSLRLENNIRTCCTKVKESITNQLRICGMQHELGTN